MLLKLSSLATLGFCATLVLGQCTSDNKLLRKEWRQLTSTEQQEYIAAEQCLQSLPSKTGLPGVVTRFDDMQAIHQIQSEIIHNVGQFLAFHRLYVRVHEELLREECGYTGAQPWWNETMDDGHYIDSPLFKPDAFGGNGASDTGCVVDGPFANYTLHLGPGHDITDHCLTRHINNALGAGSFFVEKALNATNYSDMDTFMVKVPGPHPAGHSAVGGEMANPTSSPGDPIFFLHHAWIDRIWSTWQARDPSTRLTAISGYTTTSSPFVPTTLDYELNLFGIRPNATIRDVMDISGDRICVEYS
nr:polyphenol oxidase 1 [Lyophyllum decastes]